MIKDALEYLANILRRDVTPIDLKINHPTQKMFAINGQIEPIEIPVPPRSHALASLDDFIAAVREFGESSTVFFNEKAVLAILNGAQSRCERAGFNLAESDQFARLKSLSNWLDHKSFVRLLRIDFAGCLPPSALLDIVRSIKIENGTAIKAEVGRQKESIGKTVMAEVSAEKDIPEEVTLSIPIYKSYGERNRYPICCSVEIDPMRSDAFRLLPLPDEIERIQHLAMASIRDRLTDALGEVPVFYGAP